MSEIDFSKLKGFMNGTTLTTNAVSTPKTQMVQGGGSACLSSQCIALVASEPCQSTTYYLAIMLYDAYVSNDTELTFSKGEETKLKVVMKGRAITSRAVGKQTFQILQQYA